MTPAGERWERHALCSGSTVDFFDLAKPRQALTVCGACPVTVQCGMTALYLGKGPSGDAIWGGLTPAQRKVLLRLSPDEQIDALTTRTTGPRNH